MRYWMYQYKRTWRGSITTSFLYPVLYLAAMGLGLGSRVKGRVDGVRYLDFIAPGLLASTAMQIGGNESMYPVMAAIPVMLPPTFRNFVPWDTCHSSSVRLVDLMTNSFLPAASTVPRCRASMWVWNGVMLNERIGVISASVLSDLPGDWFQPFIADDSAFVSLSF